MFAPFCFQSDDIFFPAPSDSARAFRGSLGALGFLLSEISTKAEALLGERSGSCCPPGAGSISQRLGRSPSFLLEGAPKSPCFSITTIQAVPRHVYLTTGSSSKLKTPPQIRQGFASSSNLTLQSLCWSISQVARPSSCIIRGK